MLSSERRKQTVLAEGDRSQVLASQFSLLFVLGRPESYLHSLSTTGVTGLSMKRLAIRSCGITFTVSTNKFEILLRNQNIGQLLNFRLPLHGWDFNGRSDLFLWKNATGCHVHHRFQNPLGNTSFIVDSHVQQPKI